MRGTGLIVHEWIERFIFGLILFHLRLSGHAVFLRGVEGVLAVIPFEIVHPEPFVVRRVPGHPVLLRVDELLSRFHVVIVVARVQLGALAVFILGFFIIWLGCHEGAPCEYRRRDCESRSRPASFPMSVRLRAGVAQTWLSGSISAAPWLLPAWCT